jgi:hypothetical protein
MQMLTGIRRSLEAGRVPKTAPYVPESKLDTWYATGEETEIRHPRRSLAVRVPAGFSNDGASVVSDLCSQGWTAHDWLYLCGRDRYSPAAKLVGKVASDDLYGALLKQKGGWFTAFIRKWALILNIAMYFKRFKNPKSWSEIKPEIDERLVPGFNGETILWRNGNEAFDPGCHSRRCPRQQGGSCSFPFAMLKDLVWACPRCESCALHSGSPCVHPEAVTADLAALPNSD